MNINKKNIAVFGIPRSGTTWISNVLCSTGELRYVHEPDNEKTNILGYISKKDLPRFPYLDNNQKKSVYLNLFKKAFTYDTIKSNSKLNDFIFNIFSIDTKKIEKDLILYGKNVVKNHEIKKTLINIISFRHNDHRCLVKSIHGILNIPYLKNYIDFIPIIVLRHPANVISSYINLDMPDADRKLYYNEKLVKDFLVPYIDKIKQIKDPIKLMGIQVGVFYLVLHHYSKKYNYKLIFHEDLCENPIDEFKKLFDKLELNSWSKKVEDYIISKNQRGSGYEIKRDCSELVDAWKNRLNEEDIEKIKEGYGLLDPGFYKEFYK